MVKRDWLLLLFFLACKPSPTETIEKGHQAFRLYCEPCHGENGDGRGTAAITMRPPPRDFRQGLFKFAGTSAGALPPDEALLRTLRRGLQGTAMLAWDIPEPQRLAIVQYLKMLSPRWREEAPGAPVQISPDPWLRKTEQAIARGKALYHLTTAGNAGCATCHPAYVTRAELEQLHGQPLPANTQPLYRARLRESDYPLPGAAADAHLQVLPPDFLFERLKTVWPLGARVEGHPYTAEEQRNDLYRVIAAGVGGAAMPEWKGALPEESLWALVYYVQSVTQLRGTPAAQALRDRLRAEESSGPSPDRSRP